MNCGQCRHWFDLEAHRKCPRLSKAEAQANGYIASKKGKDLDPKLFEGTAVHSPECPTFAPVEVS